MFAGRARFAPAPRPTTDDRHSRGPRARKIVSNFPKTALIVEKPDLYLAPFLSTHTFTA
jgi:hypothetical protein